MFGLKEILLVSLAANAFEFALEKMHIINFYSKRRPAWFPAWCEFCCFFWFSFIYQFHDCAFHTTFLWMVFNGLASAQLARIIHIVRLRLCAEI